MSNYGCAFKTLLEFEGGYVNDPDDLGGETNFGISKRAYPDRDIKRLTRDEVEDIYYYDFWRRYRLDEINDMHISTQALLAFVNMSPRSASIIFQEALSEVGVNLHMDGIVGSKTISSINNCDNISLKNAIRVELMRFYVNRVNINSSQTKFLVGWARRALV